MTDEELSELAECMADACTGKVLRPFYERAGAQCCCPLGAMLGGAGYIAYPNPGMVAEAIGIPPGIAYGIARGFDGKDTRHAEPRAHALGRLFREEAIG